MNEIDILGISAILICFTLLELLYNIDKLKKAKLEEKKDFEFTDG